MSTIPEEKKIDFCYLPNGNMQIYIPFKSFTTEYVVLQRGKTESGDYAYKIMLSVDGKPQVFAVATKVVDGKAIFDAMEQSGQTVLKLIDNDGHQMTTAIGLTTKNCDFFDQFVQIPELGKSITRTTTQIGTAPTQFVDIENSNVRIRNSARNLIRSHLGSIARTQPINTIDSTPISHEEMNGTVEEIAEREHSRFVEEASEETRENTTPGEILEEHPEPVEEVADPAPIVEEVTESAEPVEETTETAELATEERREETTPGEIVEEHPEPVEEVAEATPIVEEVTESAEPVEETRETAELATEERREETAPAGTADDHAPHYEAGSTRNLISIEGDVGYIYLPRTKDNPPQYLRIMQKHGQLFINMTGIEKADEPTTCQILGVSTEEVETRGKCLALELSYGGKRHNIVLPIQADPENGINAELYHDLQALTENKSIQLNQIRDWERPDVKNYAYAPEMERPIKREEPERERQPQLEGTVSLGKQTTGKGARAGQKFDDLAKDDLSTFTFGGVTYHGLTQKVKLNDLPNLGPQQKISIYQDDKTADEHLLATVTRQKVTTNPDGSETIENQTVYTVLEREEVDPEGKITRSKKLLISADYLAEMQRSNSDFRLASEITPNEDGYYEFNVQKVQLTADGELLYGIQVAGRDVAISANARGSQIITQVDGVQSRAVLMNHGSPMNIGLGTKILDDMYVEDSQVTFRAGSNRELIDGLLVQRSVLERQGKSDLVVECGIPEKDPQIRLYNAIIKQKDAEGKVVESAVNFMVRENQLFVYAKVGGKAPSWTRVDRARLAQNAVEADGSHNPALVLASGKGTSEVTIPIEMDFEENAQLLTQIYGTDLNPGFMHEALSIETKEGTKSQKSFFYKAEGEDVAKVHYSDDAPPEGALPVYERTNQKTVNNVVFDVLGNMQADLQESPVQEPPVQEETLPTPEKIEDPKKVEKPKEKEPEEWKPHDPMPGLRNCLIGGGFICVLLSVFIPGFAAVAVLLALGAFTVEAQPWNAIGQARQNRIAKDKERIENNHKQIERQLEQVNERFESAKVNLAKVEAQLRNERLSPARRRKLEDERARLQKEVRQWQKAQEVVQITAKVQAQKNLEKHQKSAIETHKRRQDQKEREQYAKLRAQAREKDETTWRGATPEERNDFDALSAREESTLTEEERERLRVLREKFIANQLLAEQQISADQSADNQHLAQLEANLKAIEQERENAEAELASAEEARDDRNPPESEWIAITSENAGMASHYLQSDPAYDRPLPGFTQGREETEANVSRSPELDAYGRRRQPQSKSSSSEREAG